MGWFLLLHRSYCGGFLLGNMFPLGLNRLDPRDRAAVLAKLAGGV